MNWGGESSSWTLHERMSFESKFAHLHVLLEARHQNFQILNVSSFSEKRSYLGQDVFATQHSNSYALRCQ